MKKQSHLILPCILLALIASTTAQTCSLSSTSSDLLQSGQNILYNANTNSPTRREHKYQFNLNFQVPAGRSLQVAACKHSITQPPPTSQSPPTQAWTSRSGEEPGRRQEPGSWCCCSMRTVPGLRCGSPSWPRPAATSSWAPSRPPLTSPSRHPKTVSYPIRNLFRGGHLVLPPTPWWSKLQESELRLLLSLCL